MTGDSGASEFTFLAVWSDRDIVYRRTDPMPWEIWRSNGWRPYMPSEFDMNHARQLTEAEATAIIGESGQLFVPGEGR